MEILLQNWMRSKQSAHHFHTIFVFWVGVHILKKANNLIRFIA